MTAIETFVFGPPAFTSEDDATMLYSVNDVVTSESVNEVNENWLTSLTKNELLELAKARAVDGIDATMRKDQIIQSLEDAGQNYETTSGGSEPQEN